MCPSALEPGCILLSQQTQVSQCMSTTLLMLGVPPRCSSLLAPGSHDKTWCLRLCPKCANQSEVVCLQPERLLPHSGRPQSVSGDHAVRPAMLTDAGHVCAPAAVACTAQALQVAILAAPGPGAGSTPPLGGVFGALSLLGPAVSVLEEGFSTVARDSQSLSTAGAAVVSLPAQASLSPEDAARLAHFAHQGEITVLALQAPALNEASHPAPCLCAFRLFVPAVCWSAS